MKALITFLFILSGLSVSAQIIRPPTPAKKIPWAGMYIVVDKEHPFPKCSDFAKLDWKALKKRHNELKSQAIQANEVTIFYPGGKKIYLTFDQLKEIACK